MKFVVENWMLDEDKRRKDLYVKLFNGNRLPHIPIEIRISNNKYSLKEHLEDKFKQLEDSLENVRRSWELRDFTDAIPTLVPDVGSSCLATAFGAEYHFSDNDDQPPGIKKPIIDDLESVGRLSAPSLKESRWLSEGLERIALFAEAGNGFVPLNALDAAGGLNVAADLLGISELLIGMITDPEAVHFLLKMIQQTYIDLIREEIKAAEGIQNLTTTDFYAGWAPPGYKGHCSDDISAMISPEHYSEFSAPYSTLVYNEFGSGGLHNCGPNPCHEAYVSQPVSPRYFDLNEIYSKADLSKLKHSFRKKAFIKLGSDETDIESIMTQYKSYMELMAPDVILIPCYTLKSVEKGKELYKRLLPISVEYAQRMDFGFDPA